jgi:hypothetical protein
VVKVQTFECDAEQARQVISEIRELPADENSDQSESNDEAG